MFSNWQVIQVPVFDIWKVSIFGFTTGVVPLVDQDHQNHHEYQENGPSGKVGHLVEFWAWLFGEEVKVVEQVCGIYTVKALWVESF